MVERTCAVEDCAEILLRGRGWCNAHYLRWRRHGDPLGGTYYRVGPRSYQWIHIHLRETLGPAANFQCPCGAQAAQWAYQYLGHGEEMRDHAGTYSTDPRDYLPMCASCHVKLDVSRNPLYGERLRERAMKGRASIARLRREDPSYAERAREASRRGGQAAAYALRLREKCPGCDLTTALGPLALHRRSTGH
jgi:hypothetical protein